MPQAKVELKPGGRGDFIVREVGRDALLWDKRRRDDDAFPEPDAIVAELQALAAS